MNKKQIIIIGLAIIFISFLFIVDAIQNGSIPIPFRYKITGTNKGAIYKTDVITGKIWLVSPEGEREITQPTPEPTPEFATINLLEIISTKYTGQIGNMIQPSAVTVIRNHNNKKIRKILFKITYSENKNSQIVDTRYYLDEEEIYAGDTSTIYVPLNHDNYWFNVQVIRAIY